MEPKTLSKRAFRRARAVTLKMVTCPTRVLGAGAAHPVHITEGLYYETLRKWNRAYGRYWCHLICTGGYALPTECARLQAWRNVGETDLSLPDDQFVVEVYPQPKPLAGNPSPSTQ
jgi:hypothetical protein